jgi:hypothetical protein
MTMAPDKVTGDATSVLLASRPKSGSQDTQSPVPPLQTSDKLETKTVAMFLIENQAISIFSVYILDAK